ncbi:unnamed protein product [Brachionus calyciflorus]|uniref:Transposase Tc1-like domain-containing protein n=1 Tax=Brachionus calyciflorus TaxID=104777 RepID=A0A814EPB6_9BILA|nr:unnamed protein product [Brachionus calyciflorus]
MLFPSLEREIKKISPHTYSNSPTSSGTNGNKQRPDFENNYENLSQNCHFGTNEFFGIFFFLLKLSKKKALEFRNCPSVTLEDRIKAVTMREQEKTLETIGNKLNRAISCIKRINYRYDETNSYKDRPRSGISTQTDDRNLIRLPKKNRTEPSHVLANQWKLSNGKTASSSLVKRRLLAIKLEWKVAVKKPRLSTKHINDRKTF